jgi:hypothetical protein
MWWAALPILVTVALAAAVQNPWLAFIPIALLVIAWVLRDRWSWPAGMRWPTVAIVAIVALAFLVQQLPDSGDEKERKPSRGGTPAGIVTIQAERGSTGDRMEGRWLRDLFSCYRKAGYEIDVSADARRDLKRTVPRRSYTISVYDFERRATLQDVSVGCPDR